MSAGAVSFKLGSFTGGAGLTEGDYLLKHHSIVLWDYDGKIAGDTIAFKVVAVPVKVNGKNYTVVGDEQSQHYSIGDPKAFSPDPTGRKIVPISARSTLGKSSNFYIYLENLVNSGFDESRFDDDVSVFDGMVAHITQIPAPQRNLPQSNLVQQANPQQQRERTISVVSFIHKQPWEAGTATAAAAAGAGTRTATKAVAASAQPVNEATAIVNGGPSDVLQTFLAQVLNGAPTVPRTQARVNVFRSMNNKVETPTRDAAIQIFNSDKDLDAVLATIGEGYYLEGTDIKKIG